MICLQIFERDREEDYPYLTHDKLINPGCAGSRLSTML